MTTALMADEKYREHLMGREHPERPERYEAVMNALARAGLVEKLLRVPSRDATEDELLLRPRWMYVVNLIFRPPTLWRLTPLRRALTAMPLPT